MSTDRHKGTCTIIRGQSVRSALGPLLDEEEVPISAPSPTPLEAASTAAVAALDQLHRKAINGNGEIDKGTQRMQCCNNGHGYEG